MPSDKYEQFFITLNPRGGVTDDLIEKVAKYSKKAYKSHFMWTEKEGDAKHIHLVAVSKNPKTLANAKVDPYIRWWKQNGWDSPEELDIGVKVKLVTDSNFIRIYFPDSPDLMPKKAYKATEPFQIISGDQNMTLKDVVVKKKDSSKYVYNAWLCNSVKPLWDEYIKTRPPPTTLTREGRVYPAKDVFAGLLHVEEFLRIQMYCVPMKMNMCKTQRAFKDLAKNVYQMVVAPTREEALKDGWACPECIDIDYRDWLRSQQY